MKIRTEYIFLLLITFCLQSQTIDAQDMSSEIKMLTKDADLILIGKVINQVSQWNQDKSRIYTDVNIEVSDLLKGTSADNKITVRHPGGEVGEVGELYTHMPRFKTNEEVLLFTRRDGDLSKYKVCFGEIGKISLIRNESDSEQLTASGKKVSILKNQIKLFLEQ